MSQDPIPERFRQRIQAAREQQLEALDLSNDFFAEDSQKLTQIPDEVFELTHLQILNLNYNRIYELPESLGNLTNLIRLDLQANQLSILPEYLAKLSNLTTLDLSGNQLTTLPESITKLSNLTTLDLSGNQLTTLPESITEFSHLTELSLSDNPLERPPLEVAEKGIGAIREYFRQLSYQMVNAQPNTKIEQHFHGNVGTATGNIEGNQHSGDTNMEGDRYINQTHSGNGDNVAGDKNINQSRNLKISGNAQVNASGAAALGLGDLSGTVANITNQSSKVNRLTIFITVITVITVLIAIFYPSSIVDLLTQKDTIKVPDNKGDKYYYELLELVLNEAKSAKSKVDFTIEKVKNEGPQIRRLLELQAKEIDVAWMMTNFEREHLAEPVRIPLTQGLLAHRICMIREENKDIFKNVKTLDDFKKGEYFVGQVLDWPDTRILRESGVKVRHELEKQQVFHQIELKQIDCIARGANEIWPELESHGELVADENILFRYNSPIYFFVSKTNSELAARIQRGLEKALENGSFCKLLMTHYGKAIEQSKLPDRKLIEIANFSLPPQTPSEYYLNFFKEPASKGECR